MEDKDLMLYDEDDAIKFIMNELPQEMKDKVSDDDIMYIVDIIYDFYESKGLMDEKTEEEATVEIDEQEMIEYILKNVKKDKIKNFTADEISFIAQGELAYCDSIGIFE